MSDSCIDLEEICLSHLSVWWAPMESFSWRHKTFSPLALSAEVHLYLGSGLHLANWGLNDSHNYTIFSHIPLYRKLIKDSTKPNHLKSDIVPQSIPYLKRASARFICKLSDCLLLQVSRNVVLGVLYNAIWCRRIEGQGPQTATLKVAPQHAAPVRTGTGTGYSREVELPFCVTLFNCTRRRRSRSRVLMSCIKVQGTTRSIDFACRNW